MSLDTAAKIARLRGLTALFDRGRESYTPFYPTLCSLRPSTGSDEQYAMLGSMPKVREWLGDRLFHSLRASEYVIKNKKWEDSIGVEKDHIDDDRLGMYGDILAAMGVEGEAHPDVLLFELILAAESQACFDGQFFFDTDHAWGGSGTQSNDLTFVAATGTTPTEAEARDAYHQARKAMLDFKRDNGEPFVRPVVRPLPNLLLLCGTGLEEVFTKALYKDLVSGGENNIVLDRPKIVSSPKITDATKFYLFNTGTMFQPFVFQARSPLQRQMKGMEDREFKDVKFMTDARYNIGYGAWWNAVLTTFT